MKKMAANIYGRLLNELFTELKDSKEPAIDSGP